MLEFIKENYKVIILALEKNVLNDIPEKLEEYEKERISDVLEHTILLDDGYLEFDSLISNVLLFDENDNLVDPNFILSEYQKVFPNILLFNDKIVRDRLLGKKYIFHPGYDDDCEYNDKYISEVDYISKHCLVSKKGFLDTSDYLNYCTFYNEDKTIHDISDLLSLYTKSFSRD